MIDKFQGIARLIRFLQLPSIAAGLICLFSILFILITSGSREGDRYLIPCILGLLWAMSLYSFIATFDSIPRKEKQTLKVLGKLKHKITRGWYWFIGLLFLGSTAGAVFLTYRMLSVWLKE